MSYETEFNFLKKILNELHLNVRILDGKPLPSDQIDLGLRKLLNISPYDDIHLREIFKKVQDQAVYDLTDAFCCTYFYMLLPENETKKVLMVGPFIEQDVSYNYLYDICEYLKLNDSVADKFIAYYSNSKIFKDKETIRSMLKALADVIWGEGNYSFKHLNLNASAYFPLQDEKKNDDPDALMMQMKKLEKRYAQENKFIRFVARGDSEKAIASMRRTPTSAMEDRVPDHLRNQKNYLIILNTILRKAAEYGKVHPIYINKVSTECANMIEHLTSVNKVRSLMEDMVRKYCQVVRTHSLKNYSSLIQKTVSEIDTMPSADHSLCEHASKLNVNSSYLSTLFKKETGMTLTEYVARARVEYAIFLLTTTQYQIQDIAHQCGIDDVNYFTRIFKKYVGVSPKEYRANVKEQIPQRI